MVRPLVPLLPPITTPPDCSCLDCVVIAAFHVHVKHIPNAKTNTNVVSHLRRLAAGILFFEC